MKLCIENPCVRRLRLDGADACPSSKSLVICSTACIDMHLVAEPQEQNPPCKMLQYRKPYVAWLEQFMCDFQVGTLSVATWKSHINCSSHAIYGMRLARINVELASNMNARTPQAWPQCKRQNIRRSPQRGMLPWPKREANLALLDALSIHEKLCSGDQQLRNQGRHAARGNLQEQATNLEHILAPCRWGVPPMDMGSIAYNTSRCL